MLLIRLKNVELFHRNPSNIALFVFLVSLFFLFVEHTARLRAPAKGIRKTRNEKGMVLLCKSAVAKGPSPRSQNITAWRNAIILD